MKRYIILLNLVSLAALNVSGQNRQDINNFSQFNNYFNPAFTGMDGSSIKNYYRDSWVSFEGAPKTLFLSGEVNLSDLSGRQLSNVQHAFGLAVFHESFGALTENKINLAYSAAIKIAEDVNLRAGVAGTYNNFKIHEQKLILDQSSDAAYMNLLNGNNSFDKFGLNIGVGISAPNYFIGYALSDLVKTADADQQYLDDAYKLHHTAIAAYRQPVNEHIAISISGIYHYNPTIKGVAEGQVKGIFLNTFWIGAGYRNDIAYTVNAGFKVKQFKLNYGREINQDKLGGAFRGGNEISLSYFFTPSLGGKRGWITW